MSKQDSATERTEKAKSILEEMGEMQKDGQVAQFPCPRSGHERMNDEIEMNALSRYAKVRICSPCGNDEAMRELAKMEPLPFVDWAMIAGLG